jgi:hypothetical protein
MVVAYGIMEVLGLGGWVLRKAGKGIDSEGRAGLICYGGDGLEVIN